MRRLLTVATCALALTGGAGMIAGCAQRSGDAGSPSGTSGTSDVPSEFRLACGRPGTLVEVLAVPVTIKHAECDLTGVRVRYGLAEAVVPAQGRAERQVETFAPTTEPTHILVVVDDRTKDVTVSG